MLHSNIILFVRQNGHFINSEDLIEIWDQAHYREREENIHRPLNSLMRFRIRKKYVYCWSTSKIFCHGIMWLSLFIFFFSFWLIFSSPTPMRILYFMFSSTWYMHFLFSGFRHQETFVHLERDPSTSCQREQGKLWRNGSVGMKAIPTHPNSREKNCVKKPGSQIIRYNSQYELTKLQFCQNLLKPL